LNESRRRVNFAVRRLNTVLLTSGESHFEAEQRAFKILDLYRSDCSPFPYEGCRRLRREFADANLEDLIPHLDLWFSDVSGFASRGKSLLRLTPDQLSAARGMMSLVFYDKHPEYAWLDRHIGARNTPDLFDSLTLAEQMRVELVDLFDFMLRNAFVMDDAEQIVEPERRKRLSHQA
jgi:hypothetical protein